MKIAILYHNDADGFGAAYAFWTSLGKTAYYIPVQYKESFPVLLPETTHIYILDFSYSREFIEELRSKYECVTIIDHHQTALTELGGMPYTIIDTEYSGAVLAWHFLYGEKPPDILRYVQDYDLWKFELPFSKEVNRYIASLAEDFEIWDTFDLEEAVSIGKGMVRLQEDQVRRASKRARFGMMDGYRVPILNLTENISETGNYICQENPTSLFSVSYFDRADGKRTYSLRSIGKFDVSLIAQNFGGGGHRNAAGFSLPQNQKNVCYHRISI